MNHIIYIENENERKIYIGVVLMISVLSILFISMLTRIDFKIV